MKREVKNLILMLFAFLTLIVCLQRPTFADVGDFETYDSGSSSSSSWDSGSSWDYDYGYSGSRSSSSSSSSRRIGICNIGNYSNSYYCIIQ